MAHTTLILLAAGGEPLLRRTVETAVASVCDSVIVVLGPDSESIRRALADLPVEIVVGKSIRAGLEAAQSYGADGVLLARACQHLVSTTTLNKLVLANRATNQPIIASQYKNAVGLPVFFAKEFFPHLLALRPDEGCKGLILAHPAETVRLAFPEAELGSDNLSQNLCSSAVEAQWVR
jgi:molybdenum cofactor cytidylyltransferase